jgi:hypothetical protein
MSFLDTLMNKGHMVAGGVYGFGIAAYYAVGRIKYGVTFDLGPNFVTASGFFYAFLAGHYGFSQKWPDQPASTPTV